MSTPWYAKGETGEYLRDWADALVHGENPDWLGLGKKAKKAGLTDSEVNEFLRSEEQSPLNDLDAYYGSI